MTQTRGDLRGIDWTFIQQNEGWRLEGYVPNPRGSNSGVTIANGFDLGAHSPSDLRNLGLGLALCKKLEPYCGHKKQKAVNFLKAHPLRITQKQAETIRDALHEYSCCCLERLWNAEAEVPWYKVPNAAKTVIASVAYQYGITLRRCPNFRRQALTGDWLGMLANLRDFGDDYPTRRNREADLLELYLKRSGKL